MNRALGPGSAVFTTPLGARCTLLAATASKSPGGGREQLDMCTIPKVATRRAYQKEKLWAPLPVITPFPSHHNIVMKLIPPTANDDPDRGGARGEHVKPRLVLRERGSRRFEFPLMLPLFEKPNSHEHVVNSYGHASQKHFLMLLLLVGAL